MSEWRRAKCEECGADLHILVKDNDKRLCPSCMRRKLEKGDAE